MRHLLASLTAALIVAAPAPAAAQRVIHVDTDATGASDGSTWADAFVFLQDALAVAQDGDEVWVAEGVYRPDQGAGITAGDREVSFELSMGVRVYGGFSGVEQSRDDRDPSRHEVVLSGDLLGNDTGELDPEEPSRTENSLNVVLARASSKESVLDGFTVTAGNGFAESSRAGAGIGMLSSATFRHLVIRGNLAPSGGGMFISEVPDGGAVLEDLVFENNRAPASAGRGGGLAIDDSGRQRFDRLSFFGNAGTNGGGLFNAADDLICIDCTFVGNTSGEGGGIFTEHPFGLRLINGVLLGNYGSTGGGIAAHRSNRTPRDVIIVNTLVAGNSAIWGGGIAASGLSAQIVNSTVVYNSATKKGGGILHVLNSGDTLRISNSIVWGNSADMEGDQLYVYLGDHDGGGMVLRNSLLEGTLPNYVSDDGATITAPPLFSDPDGFDGILGTSDDDYRLTAGSPAIDAGDRTLLPADSLDLDRDGLRSEPLPVDLLHNVRVHDGGSGMDAVDLGPYEFGSPPLTLGSRSEPMHATTSDPIAALYPNPFAHSLTSHIRALPGQVVEISIVDMLGRLVYSGSVERTTTYLSRTYEIRPGALPPGVYAFVVRVDGAEYARPVVRLPR